MTAMMMMMMISHEFHVWLYKLRVSYLLCLDRLCCFQLPMLHHRVNSRIHDDHDNNKDNDNDQICTSHVGREILFHLDCFCCMSCLQVVKLQWHYAC